MDFFGKNHLFKMVLKTKEVLREDASPSIQKLSHKIVRLLRWDLPLSGIHFSSLDRSARPVDVARHLLSSAEAIITAASSDGIVRVVTFQLIPQEGSEVKISACGGHGFPVFSPPGHTLLPEFAGPGLVAPLFHEIGSANAIKQSGGLLAMERIGGINFNSKICGGYCPRADSIIKIKEEELILAIKEGFQCQVLSKSVSSGTDNF